MYQKYTRDTLNKQRMLHTDFSTTLLFYVYKDKENKVKDNKNYECYHIIGSKCLDFKRNVHYQFV